MRLPNFPIYIKKIRRWAKAGQIAIRKRKNLPCEGVYYPHNRTIAYCSTLTESEVITCLLHELGHLMDDYAWDGKYSHKYLVDGLENLEKSKLPTKLQKEKILETERGAWRYAESLAKMLKIPLGKWYFKDKRKAFDSYLRIRTRD